jgi:hypothetical protein
MFYGTIDAPAGKEFKCARFIFALLTERNPLPATPEIPFLEFAVRIKAC